jgi:hypothetical protein
MAHVFYENFDLHITPVGNKKYTAKVSGALGGDPTVQFSLESAPEEVVNAIGRNFGIVSPAPATAGNGSSRQVTGKYLFETIFEKSPLLASLQVTLDRAKARNANLRLRLNLTDAPELVGLPWEMLTSQTNPLALAVQTSVVRYQDVPFPPNTSTVKEKPLRMLVVISNPAAGGIPPLDVEKEYKLIKEALKPLEGNGLIEIKRLERATTTALDDYLFNQTAHIFHYIGHGTFDSVSGKGQLVFERDQDDTSGQPFELVDGERLGQSLRTGQDLRLATLNSCEGSVVSDTDSYAGVAQHLLRTGNVPIVIAMRRKVSDDVAVAFGQTFYQWLLVNNLSVDAAMTRARLRMLDVEKKRNPNGLPTEWGTPVMFMRGDHDGYLVEFDQGSVKPPSVLPEDIGPDMAKHYQTVISALTKGKLVPFLGLDVNLYGRDLIKDWKPNGTTLPSYAELVDYLVKVTNHPRPYLPALADVSQYAYLFYSQDETLGPGSFYDELSTIFSGDIEPTPLHKFWAQLAALNNKLTSSLTSKDDVNRRFLIVSSTYDNLLETAFRKTLDRFHVVSYVAHGDFQGRFRHTVYAKAGPGGDTLPQTPAIVEPANNYPALFDSAPVILKVPGTVGDAAGLRFAITEDQYLDLFARRELANIVPSQLLTKIRNSNQLFLGCNVREWSLRALLYRVWEDSKPPLASWTVQEEMTPVQTEYWKAWGVRIIQRNLTNYVDDLKRSCQTVLPDLKGEQE